MTERRYDAWVWKGALLLFCVAALTGSLFRFSLAGIFRLPLELTNVRHAHSHLMYFGWVSPLLMILIDRYLRPETRRIRWIVGGAFVFAALAYTPFLLWGYQLAPIAGRRLPLSVMAAGLNVIPWYAFAIHYVVVTRSRPRNGPLILWDIAVVFLVVATLGAWGLALSVPLGIQREAMVVALTHFFLDSFSEGWMVAGVLGLAMTRIVRQPGIPLTATSGDGFGNEDAFPTPVGAFDAPLIAHTETSPSFKRSGAGAGFSRLITRFFGQENEWPFRFGALLMALGIPVLFALGLPHSVLPGTLQFLTRIAVGLVFTGTLLVLTATWSLFDRANRHLWAVPFALLLAKVSGALLSVLVPGGWLAADAGARVLYLHLMLLGFVTPGLVIAAEKAWAVPGRFSRFLQPAVLAVLASLVLLMGWWSGLGFWRYQLAAWISLLPVTALIVGLLGPGQKR